VLGLKFYTFLGWYALTVGLLTEAVIFAISGIIPPEPDYYWEKYLSRFR
jgi:hypothetical protein